MLQRNQVLSLSKTALIALLAGAMIIYPQEVLSGATHGIEAWAKFVLPALLPFFILSELLMGTGFVHLLGVILEPVMRPVFGLPGNAAFVVAMGFTSGSPIGTVLTTKLYREKLLTRIEAERLFTFTNNASPGFMLGAVAAGMFGNPGLGLTLAFSNYLANLLLGVGLRFYGKGEPITPPAKTTGINIWRRAVRAMLIAQRKDGRPLGQLIGDAIRSSINTILFVGGFVLLFSVLIRILDVLGVMQIFVNGLGHLLRPLGVDQALYPGLVNGLLEVTLGAKAATQVAAPLTQQILLVAGILGWAGISVHAQVLGLLSGTPIRFLPFLVGRAVQAILATLIAAAVVHFTGSAPVFAHASLGPLQTQLLALILAILSTFLTVLLCSVVFLTFKRKLAH